MDKELYNMPDGWKKLVRTHLGESRREMEDQKIRDEWTYASIKLQRIFHLDPTEMSVCANLWSVRHTKLCNGYTDAVSYRDDLQKVSRMAAKTEQRNELSAAMRYLDSLFMKEF